MQMQIIVTEDEVREAIAKLVSEQMGIEVRSGDATTQYRGIGDDAEFDGFKFDVPSPILQQKRKKN